MTSKLTREQLRERAQLKAKNLASAISQSAFASCRSELEEEFQFLQCALACMEGEPVAWTDEEELRDAKESGSGYLFGIERDANKFADPRRQIMLYRHAQPAPERDNVRREHAEWSQATFGNVGPIGPLKHLSKEALEAAAEPGDLSEWADMQFLLWDAQRRAGITDEQITQAMIEKLAVNKLRSWPEPKDGEPRLHIKAQPAPVVPDLNVNIINDDRPIPNPPYEGGLPKTAYCGAGVWISEPITPDTLESVLPPEMVLRGNKIINPRNDGLLFMDEKPGDAPELRGAVSDFLSILDEYPEQLEPVNRASAAVNALRVAMLQAGNFQSSLKIDHESTFIKHIKSVSEKVRAGNSPVIPEGYVMVPNEPTEAMINAWLSEVANWRGHVAGYKAMLAAAPQEVKGE